MNSLYLTSMIFLILFLLLALFIMSITLIIISQIDRRKKKTYSDLTQIGTDRSPTGRAHRTRGEINEAASSRDWRSMESFCWIQAGNTNLFPNSHFNPLAGIDCNTTLGKSNASIFFVWPHLTSTAKFNTKLWNNVSKSLWIKLIENAY